MNKFFRIIFVILSVSILFTACSSDNKKQSSTDKKVVATQKIAVSSASPASPVPSATQKPLKAMDALFTAEHTLKIEKKGDKGFNEATDVLTYIIADLFVKAIEVEPSSPQGAGIVKNYDFTKYDFKLQFSGTQNILVSVKDNLAHFENEKILYGFWGDTSKLWDGIKINNEGKYELAASGYETMIKKYQQDITGNGQKTDISLVYKASDKKDFKGDLILRVGNSQSTVYPSLLWQLRPNCTVNNAPEIKFISEKTKKNKAMIVFFSQVGYNYSQTGEVFAYSYNNGSIKEVDFTAPTINLKYNGGDKYTAEFPQINSLQEVRFNSAVYSRSIDKDTTLEKVLNEKIGFYHQPISFLINDYNKDGMEELCSMANLMIETDGKMSMGIEYTFYSYEAGVMKPFKVYIAPPFNQKDKTTTLERNIINMLFTYRSFTLGDKGIENKWYSPSKDYSEKELIDMVNSLLSKNVLKKNGKEILFNF